MANQTWIILFEPMSSAAYTNHSHTLTNSEQERLSLSACLQTVGLQPSSKDYVGFFIKSNSLKTAMFLPDDNALSTIYQQHCKSDPVITIIIRPSNDPTPCRSHDASAIYSFLERIKVSGHMWNASGAVEPERLKHLAKLSSDYPSFENNAKRFVQDLAVSHAAWAADDVQRIARRRLSSVGNLLYLGAPYFSTRNALDILDIPIQCYTLQDVLGATVRLAASGNGEDHAFCELCTLAPLFVYAFGFTWEDIKGLNISLQQIDSRKRQKKNHGKVCRLRKRLRSW